MKTLGTGFTKGVGWTDIEVISQNSGKPIIVLGGTTAEVAQRQGIDEILITISHCRAYATATAIAVQRQPRNPS